MTGALKTWESQAQIREVEKNKTQNVKIEVYASSANQTRLEVSAIMGYRVASVVMSPEKWGAAIYPQKKFYHGQKESMALQALLQIPLTSKDMMNVLMGRELGVSWKCEGPRGAPSQCEKKDINVKIAWLERSAEKQLLHVTSPQFELKWSISPPQTEVQFKADLFTLTQPKGFKAIQLN